MLRVIKGGFEPADSYVSGVLRQRGYAINDIVGAVITKINNPKFNGLHHRIGQLCAANIETFEGMEAHAVLKRLQWEGNIWCEEIPVFLDGGLVATMRFPRSMSFENMDDGERKIACRDMCRLIAKKYWPTITPEQVEAMAESFVTEAT